MAQKHKPSTVRREETVSTERINMRLDLLDQRLDNIDSVISAVVERVMNQPIALNVTCPHCSKNIEITLIGSGKPKR